jgi:hypothetical protein
MQIKNTGVQLVTVVEGLNETLKERYLGATMLLADELQRRVERRAPPVPAHWKRQHDVVFRCLEYAVPRRGAKRFASRHAKDDPRPGWKEIFEVD